MTDSANPPKTLDLLHLSPKFAKRIADLEEQKAQLEEKVKDIPDLTERAKIAEDEAHANKRAAEEYREEASELWKENLGLKNETERLTEQLEQMTFNRDHAEKKSRETNRKYEELKTSVAASKGRAQSKAEIEDVHMVDDDIKADSGPLQAEAIQAEASGQPRAKDIEMKDAADEDIRPICHFLLANNCKRGKKCPHGRHPDKATLKNARARGETRDLELQVISITALDTLKPFGRKMEAQLSVYTAL